MNKIDNSNIGRKVLEGTELSDASITLILDSIADMQEKIETASQKKLQEYVQSTHFNDVSSDTAILNRRMILNETAL